MICGELLRAAAEDPMARLRWLVLKKLCLAPCSEEARSMTDSECLCYAAHMVLDAGAGGVGADNPAFDMRRFRELEEGRA